MKTLCGVTFVYNGIVHDYNTKETILSLQDFCDHVVVLDAGSTDGTKELVKSCANEKTTVVLLDNSEWNNQHGKEKLSYFTNKAIEIAEGMGYDYIFYLQTDEIVHEDSYGAIWASIGLGHEGFLVQRLNLWKDCNSVLDVPQHRKPCSTQVIRLAKSKYRAIDDAESLNAPIQTYLENVEIWHYGFVRKKEVMKSKIIHMQRDVFQIDYDPKLNNMEVFDSTAWFTDEDLKPITKSHPKIMQEWVKTRL